MAKWYGMIGFSENAETEPGYYEEIITEKPYYGDSIKNTRSIQTPTNGTNENVNISNQISILADPYANNHIYSMRYATFQGAKWKVTNVDVQYPRLILSLGGLWNGN